MPTYGRLNNFDAYLYHKNEWFLKIVKGRSVARCPRPRNLIKKLIKLQVQIYYLQL